MGQRFIRFVPLLLWVTISFDGISIVLSAANGKYLGCFKDNGNPRAFKGHAEHLGGTLTPQKCTELCYSKGFLYSATQDGSYCFCGDKHPYPTSKVSEDWCSKPCSGNPAVKCGGSASISVTETGIPDHSEAKQYLGCFEDTYRSFNDVLLTYHTTNTPRRCMNVCLQLGHKYAGVRDSKECICGNAELGAELVRSGEECSWPCTGDSSQNCGGSQRIALYSTNVANVAPGAWPPLGKKRFFVVTSREADWQAAFMHCIKNNSRLASIDSVEEFQEIKQEIAKNGVSGIFWTSASDSSSEGNFVWASTGKPLSLPKELWHYGEPNNAFDGKEQCVEIRYDKLNDTECRYPLYFVCEYYT